MSRITVCCTLVHAPPGLYFYSACSAKRRKVCETGHQGGRRVLFHLRSWGSYLTRCTGLRDHGPNDIVNNIVCVGDRISDAARSQHIPCSQHAIAIGTQLGREPIVRHTTTPSNHKICWQAMSFGPAEGATEYCMTVSDFGQVDPLQHV